MSSRAVSLKRIAAGLPGDGQAASLAARWCSRDGRMMGFVEIRRARRRAEAEQLALVLAAVGIGCTLVPGSDGVGLEVAWHDAERARQQLAAYEQENAPEPQPVRERWTAGHGLTAALAYAAIILFFFGAERRGAWALDWITLGAADAGLIRAGQWWRTVTALTLHADHEHLFGNLIAGIAFGTLAAQLFGAGLAWLAILLTGIVGNALDAFLQAPDHAAVGASTALFGALGIVSGYTRLRRKVPWRGGIRRWAPLSAGVLLLVYLGFAGERTDVGAHVAGFVVGGLLGLALGRWGDRVPRGPGAQLVYGLLAAGILTLAWLRALQGAG
jgi:rhomboid protease GluP